MGYLEHGVRSIYASMPFYTTFLDFRCTDNARGWRYCAYQRPSHDILTPYDCLQTKDWLVGPGRRWKFETASRAHMPKMTELPRLARA